MTLIPTILSTLYISFGLAVINYIPWDIIFIFTKSYGLRIYTLRKKEECKLIQKKIGQNCSHLTDNNKGCGYAYGYWYVLHLGYNAIDGEYYTITLIATESSYKNLIKEENYEDEKQEYTIINEPQKKININIYDCTGSFQNRWYRKRTIRIPNLISRPNQKYIIEQICDHQKKTKHTTVYLHGPIGSGKSMIGLLLTDYYKGSYCNNLIVWNPGDVLGNLYLDADPTEDNPLIVVFEEIDIALVKINEGIPDHKNLSISIQNKMGWNNLFDSIQMGMYPNLIVLLTSNKSPEFINELDASYLRKGRIDFIFELNNDGYLE